MAAAADIEMIPAEEFAGSGSDALKLLAIGAVVVEVVVAVAAVAAVVVGRRLEVLLGSSAHCMRCDE